VNIGVSTAILMRTMHTKNIKPQALPIKGAEPLLVTDNDAAKMLGVSRSTIWSLTAQGLLSPVRLPPRTTRWRAADIRRLAGV
jgi:predicted DNA-binding transcriptional regulator AlpA